MSLFAAELAHRKVAADAMTGCLHCGQALPQGEVSRFCCAGCRSVYALISKSGLDRYYMLRGDRLMAPAPNSQILHDRQWLEALLATTPAGPVRRFTMDVQGIQCTACVWLIETLFKRAPEAYQIRLNPALGRLSVAMGPDFDLSRFVDTVEHFGYRLGPAKKSVEGPSRALTMRMGICLALAGNTMLLSCTTYFGLESGPLFALVQQVSFAMATLSLVIGGSYFFERAFQSLKRGVLHLDLPIAVGMTFAYAGSVWSLFFGGARASYLDTVAVFIALMLVGRVLQERLVERNRRQLLASDGASSLTARRVQDGRPELVPCRTLVAGDGLLVCPGEIVPVRARLLSARAMCSLDWINGESAPRSFSQGDELTAGAINVGQQALDLVAVAAFDRSELDLLLREDPSSKARVRGDFWDRLARIYVALVLIAAALGVALWLALGKSLLDTLDMATAVLVITCPCAFGIATPLAYELAVNGLRKAGLFVREGSFFDRAASVKRIVFDKTGTLTTGGLVVRDPSKLSELSPEMRQVLYDLTARSNHPKSAAIARTLNELDPTTKLSAVSVSEVTGKGLECLRDGACFRFGDPRWALSATSAAAAKGPVLSRDGVLLTTLEAVEVARPDAAREVAALAAEGYELWIASGDDQARVSSIAADLAIPSERALGGLDPEGKRALIEALDQKDTLMIGDGINDGLALSRAHCSGTPAVDRPFVPARADFYFLTAGLLPLRTALHASRAVRRVVHNALFFATAYNVVAVGLSFAGLMHPWLAAVLMPTSSAVVLTYTAFALSPRRPLWRS